MLKRPDSPLRTIRKSRTLTQAELAQIAGLSQHTISQAENGNLQLRPDVQARLAAILGTSRDELFPDVVSA